MEIREISWSVVHNNYGFTKPSKLEKLFKLFWKYIHFEEHKNMLGARFNATKSVVELTGGRKYESHVFGANVHILMCH